MPHSPVPDAVGTELERVARRWQNLPLDHALSHVPAVLALSTELAQAADPTRAGALPDLGPATALDQLRVTVYDAFARGSAPPDVLERLVGLRRTIA
ncbi:hypothetical protein ACMYYO_12545 [Dermacoccaceae bacterium W4C1]